MRGTMPFPDQNSTQMCVCRGTVSRTQRYIRSPSVDITLIVDLIEELTSSVQFSSRGTCGCLQLSEFVQMLLDTTDALFNILDVTWNKTVLGATPSSRVPFKSQVAALGPVGSTEKKLYLPIITGFKHIITVDQFILDVEERNLVLQEIFRGSLLSINCIVRDLHDLVTSPGQCNSWPLEKMRMNVQSTILLEQTYSALARYGRSLESNV